MNFSPLVDCISNVNLKESNLYNNRNTTTLSRRLRHYLSDNRHILINFVYKVIIILPIFDIYLQTTQKYINCQKKLKIIDAIIINL